MSSKRKQIHGRNPSRGDKDGNLTPVRVGGRIKKAKTIFDPSDNLYPRKRRMNLLTVGQGKKAGEPGRKMKDSQNGSRVSNGEDGESPDRKSFFYQGWCLICLKNQSQAQESKLITCLTCPYKAHFECIDKKSGVKFEDLENEWLCPQCKICTVCQKTSDSGTLTQCTRCYDFYHNACHRPRITKNSKRDKWICRSCHEEELSEMSSESEAEESEASEEATPPVKRPSPAKEEAKEALKNTTSEEKKPDVSLEDDKSDKEAEKSVKDEKVEKTPSIVVTPFAGEPVPDASTWTAAEVYSYFSRHFPNEAEVFREQEIDGASLVLMKRDDVVSGLKLKLGPAIRIYRHVLMLQKRSSDPRLSWF